MKISLLADCPNEASTIAKWYFQQWAHNEPESTLDSVNRKVLLSANRNEVPMAFVAHIEGDVAGAGEIKYRELPEYQGFSYWLDGVYVPIKHRGKGVSTALIEFSKLKAFELKLPALYLRCEEHNVKLYQAHGFNVVLVEPDRFIMELQINTRTTHRFE